jgi:hypothetical protein
MGSLTHFVGIRPAFMLFGTLAVAAGLWHRRRLRQATVGG